MLDSSGAGSTVALAVPLASLEQARGDDLLVDLELRRAWLGARELQLTCLERRVLLHLWQNKGRIVGRNEILRVVWGCEYVGDYAVLRTVMKNLRKKLSVENARNAAQARIKTLIGDGYLLQ